jgi:hypothetical protein
LGLRKSRSRLREIGSRHGTDKSRGLTDFWDASAGPVLVVREPARRLSMSVLSWIVFGLIAAFVSIGREGVTGFNLHRSFVVIGGSVVLLLLLHLFRRTSRSGAT